MRNADKRLGLQTSHFARAILIPAFHSCWCARSPYGFNQFTTDEVDLEAYRARLRKMTDEELIREGRAGRYLCSPMANFGKPPRKVFVIQLDEVKAEWRRRHPK
jgi:hypothetical protein